MRPELLELLPCFTAVDLQACPYGRAGGNRTPNLRFWRPPLCQLSYCPVNLRDHLGHNPCAHGLGRTDHAITLATTPAPTVLPPSRMANGSPRSIAIGAISSTTILMLSPGITISVPSGNSTAPVTSVVRK